MRLRLFILLMLFITALGFLSCGNAEYDKAIVNADALFKSKDYTEARVAYAKALKISPDEKYPKSQISKIENHLADIAKKKAIEDEKKYNVLIEKADKLFADKDLKSAKVAYQNASKFKLGETYPKSKIAEINKIFEEEESMKNYPYHIVVGCFEIDRNAERFFEKVQSEYSSHARRESLGRLDAIIYKSYRTMQDAYNDLSKARQIGGEAWVLKRQF